VIEGARSPTRECECYRMAAMSSREEICTLSVGKTETSSASASAGLPFRFSPQSDGLQCDSTNWRITSAFHSRISDER